MVNYKTTTLAGVTKFAPSLAFLFPIGLLASCLFVGKMDFTLAAVYRGNCTSAAQL